MASSIKQSVQRQTEAVLRGKSRINFNQLRQRHFWSSYFFQPDANGVISAGRYTLFTTPVGSNGQGFPSGFVLTERESNWKSQNRVPDNQNFEIMELGAGIMSASFAIATGTQKERMSPPSAWGLSSLFSSAVLGITYLTNTIHLGRLVDYPQPGGPFLAMTNDAGGATADVGLVVQNGMGSPALRRKHKVPLVLGAGESFNFTIELGRSVYIGDSVNRNPFLVRVDFWATESYSEKS